MVMYEADLNQHKNEWRHFFVSCLKTTVDTIYQNQTAKEFATTDKFINMKKIPENWKWIFHCIKPIVITEAIKSIEWKLYWKQNKTSKTSFARSPVII